MNKDVYNLSTRKAFPCRENLRRVKVNLLSFSFLFISKLNKVNLQGKMLPYNPNSPERGERRWIEWKN
jgi:hypothetical protein